MFEHAVYSFCTTMSRGGEEEAGAERTGGQLPRGPFCATRDCELYSFCCALIGVNPGVNLSAIETRTRQGSSNSTDVCITEVAVRVELPTWPMPATAHCYVGGMAAQSIRNDLAAFVAERDWGQFHTRENLAKSISIEAGELLECFQWGADADPARLRDELADVLTYCFLLAGKLGVDPDQIVLDKLAITREKYPVDKARGSSAKYDVL